MRWRTHKHGNTMTEYIKVHLRTYLKNLFPDQAVITTEKDVIYYIVVMYYKLTDINLAQMYRGDKIHTKAENIEIVTHEGDTKLTLTITI